MLASAADCRRSRTPVGVMREGKASAGIQFAPRQKISLPLTLSAKRLPAYFARTSISRSLPDSTLKSRE